MEDDGPPEVSAEVLAALRLICSDLPDAYEEPAWVGTRWRIRQKTFAHVAAFSDASSPTFAKLAQRVGGPGTCLVFRSDGPELVALRNAGPPFFYAGWGRDVIGLLLSDRTDWDEVRELLTESYCTMAPKKLRALVDRPGPDVA